jgi:hypothetical protein
MRERRRAREERDYARWRQEQRQESRQERRYARTRDDEASGREGREFIDDRGVRHIIMPRRSSERSDRTMAFEEPARQRRFFLFPPFRLGGDDDDD